MNQKIQKRLEYLINQGEEISVQSYENTNGFMNFSQEAKDLYTQWLVSSKSLLKLICDDKKAIHYELFLSAENKVHSFETPPLILKRLISILKATLDDMNSGCLTSYKQLIQADVFDSELDQAKHFLESGYPVAAAVTAGVVLETSIKELCKNNGIDIFPPDSTKPKKLDVLNAALKNADIYNVLQQKKITTLADIRNNAAHGNTNQFTNEDVKDMIRDIERFLLEYTS
ncbi:DUF4145 domain-containing protein [Acinetobacter baumannii]|uniref:DUF4145 domain-containing protein n=1 Tax=Acinetobacter baumannii TaxID=470 RepID=A0A505MAR7_ACIBA|nr:DUF4145 domain-containing protein [Acinetobacter baumannii]EJB8497260.1 DUF4145 domain-containing protein [Acinetobacter baumannii]ELB0343102.1 DUF4145 domain-containing protein [Acinetobacter baumannii]EMC7949619.1 DUF4145 domain-containing protein [Acinetobacter baumannii]EMD9690973.1 DUF4145 domain-containing protein [Acinetobacter baumannii]KCY18954.1 hypothetical protein J635_4093 [Acinetobacter baumannii 233846]